MKIVFVGSLVDRETLKSLPDASVAGNKMQMGFVKGFIHAEVPTEVISVEPYGMWKGNDKPLFVNTKTYYDEDVEIRTLPYINVLGIKQLSIFANLLRNLWKIKTDDDLVIVVYNTMSMFALPVLWMSKLKKAKCASIVADLPLQRKKSVLHTIEDKLQQKLIDKFDVLITLTESITRDFAPGKPHITIEAGCDPNDYMKKTVVKQNKQTKDIVFSGTLNQLSGIELILEAMKRFKEESIKLHIYGDGPLRTLVQNVVHDCHNICYHGRVSNDEMLQIQQQADLLICPRCADDFTTKYTFPSKVLEYICAGVPVLSNKLEGIPKEYENYVNFSKSESPEDWAKEIYRILIENPGFYYEKASKARKTVLDKKSWNCHGKKIVDFFTNYLKDSKSGRINDKL